MDFRLILNIISNLFGPYMHAKRIHSLANATLGTHLSCSLAISSIGNALSLARGLERKHAIKQIDRLLTNTKLNVWQLFSAWVPYVVGCRTEILISIDWLKFDTDGHSSQVINMLTSSGSIPLLWRTYLDDVVHGRHLPHERIILTRLKQVSPKDTSITVLTDSNHIALAEWLENTLGFNYIMRVDAEDLVGYPHQPMILVKELVTPTSRTRTIKGLELGRRRLQLKQLYCYKNKHMKGNLFLASNRNNLDHKEAWQIYSQYRSAPSKNGHGNEYLHRHEYMFYRDMENVSISSPLRRDRLFLLRALADNLYRSPPN